jgi:hypothetical protein
MGVLIFGFPTSHAAVRAERGFKERGFDIELVPVPRQLSSECGFCLRASMTEDGAARDEALAFAAGLGCSEAWIEISMEVKRYERIQ